MADEQRPHVRLLTANSWATLIFFALTSTLLAVCLKHIGDEFGIGYGLKGRLAPVRSLALAIAAFGCGYLADRIGKKHLMAVSMFCIAGGVFWVARCSTYAGLMTAMLLMGFGLGGVEGLVSPLIAELHPRSVSTQLNVLHAFYPTGLMLTAAVAGAALKLGATWRSLFNVSVLPIAAIGVVYLLCRFPEETHAERRKPLRVRGILRNPTFWVLALIMMLTAGSEGSLLYWGPNFLAAEYGSSALVGGAGVAVFGGAMAVGRFGMSAALRVCRLERLMLGMAVLGGLGTLGLVLIDHLWTSVVLMAMAGLFCAAFWPNVLSLANEQIAAGSSTLLAMMSVAGIVGFGGGPALVGVVAEGQGADLRAGMALVPMGFALAGLLLIPVLRAATRTPAPER